MRSLSMVSRYLSGDLESQSWVLHPSGLGLLESALAGQEDGRLLLEGPLGLTNTQQRGKGRKKRKKQINRGLEMYSGSDHTVSHEWGRVNNEIGVGVGVATRKLFYKTRGSLVSKWRPLFSKKLHIMPWLSLSATAFTSVGVLNPRPTVRR